MSKVSISVIVSTYNWPQALKTVLLALNENQETDFEVIVADDGSSAETGETIEALSEQVHYPLFHVWQDDDGFRVARARNIAVHNASGDYLLFIDQDTIPRFDFIKKHRALAEPGYFVSGSRIFLHEALTNEVLTQSLDITRFPFLWYLNASLKKKCNRCLPMLRLRLPRFIRKLRKTQWKGTKNLLGIWRADMIDVNGYDETFVGWGYEDSDLVCRLLAKGTQRKEGKFATEVVHLHHEIRSRDEADSNYALLEETILGKRPVAVLKGISQHG